MAGVSYAEGLTYLDSARANMRAGLNSVDQVDRATRLGVGIGVGGAGMTAAFRGPADAVLGFLTLGGVSYAVNQGAVPTAQAAIYTAGLKNLMCIEQTAARVYEETAYVRGELAFKLPRLQAAKLQLKMNVDKARIKAKSNITLGALVSQADTALKASDVLVAAVQKFLGASNIGNEIYAGVSLTVEEVNRQLRRQTPDIDAIAQSGSILKGFIGSHSQLESQSAATKGAIESAGRATAMAQNKQVAPEPLINELKDDLEELHKAVADTQASFPVKGEGRSGEAIASCQTVVPGDGPVTVDPAGPITLIAGGHAFNVRVSGNKSLSPRWKGRVPAATELIVSKPSDDLISLAAPAGAKPDKYVLYIHQDAPAKDSPEIEINVSTAPAGSGAPNQGAKPVRGAAQIPPPPPPVGAKFAADRRLLGLGPGVTATSDPLWTGRVNKLDNCFGISPSTGQITTALRDALAKRVPVNSAGDCPALLSAGPAPNPVPGPVPAPPQNPTPGPVPTPKPNQ